MRKVIRNGKVAVVYSPGWGSGFCTWNKSVKGIEELIYLPELVDLIEQKKFNAQSFVDVIEKYSSIDPDDLLALDYELAIAWVPEGELFTIEEYDGAECIRVRDNFTWLQA